MATAGSKPPCSGVQQYLWELLVRYARTSIISTLHRGVCIGQLRIDEGPKSYLFGISENTQHESASDVGIIDVQSETFWARVYLSHDIGFAEAYMHGDFTTSNLKAILNIWLDNRDTLAGLVSMYSYMSSSFSAIAARFFGQTLSNAKLNAMTGYDCGNEFFKMFLSKDMTYSSALWPDATGGVRGDLENHVDGSDLQTAQMHKIQHILKKARLRSGDRLLEFGSGWGAMAIQAARMGCTVDTFTLSVQQKQFVDLRLAEEGLSDKVTVHLQDYRDLPADFKGSFDALISVEMVEPDRAAVVITATTQPESRYSEYQSTDYARRYQWPNSFCPSVTSFVTKATSATSNHFVVESVEDFGIHYPRTLREWGRRLQANWNSDTVAAMLKDQLPVTNKQEMEVFKRKWEYMYVYAEVGYARAYTSMHYFTFARPENIVEVCA